jgi:K+-sensing histidine kinase KdpD
MKKKVLVCITIQENSKRLIKEGAALASSVEGELHILHVEKGMSIFDQEDAIKLLENLFELGKELGGEVHFMSNPNIPEIIIKVIKDLNISHVMLGQSMENKIRRLLKKDVNNKIQDQLDNIEVIIVDRKEEFNH